jgi:hypothetical protein
MSVSHYREIIDNRGGTQRFGENVKCKRTFMVTVDDPTTPVTDISNAPGVAWLDQHPEFPAVYVTDIAAECDGDPLHYKVTFTYDLIKAEDRFPMPWEREPKFTFGGSVTTAPAVVHYNDGPSNPKFILNSAGDPLEGAEKEHAEWRIQIQINEETFDYSRAMQYVNAVNSDTWSGAAAGTCKVQSISGSREVEQVNNEEVAYWAVTIDIAYRQEGWKLKLWDVGFNEIVGGQRKKILDQLKEPVSEPVALQNGAAKTPGQPPNSLEFKVYKEVTFSGTVPNLPT